MHTRTETLLSEGTQQDKGDAALAAGLRALPELAPPERAWSRIAAAAATARRRRTRYRQGLGLAAGLAGGALALGLWLRASEPNDGAEAVAARPAPALETPIAYDSLLAESARLERLLLELPRHGRVMNAATAGTIVGLEDRVALIDERLMLAAASGAEPERRQVLWRERVDVMNALVQVRYAQARDIGF